MNERAHMIAQLNEISHRCGASVSATNRTDAICTQLLARFDEQEATCKAQAQAIAGLRAAYAAKTDPHPSVKGLRARIANLERDRDEKAAAIRSQEKECTRLRETVEHQRHEIGKLFARANERDIWKLRATHHENAADQYARRHVEALEHLAAAVKERDEARQAAADHKQECDNLAEQLQNMEDQRDRSDREHRALMKERNLAHEGQANNARRLVAVCQIMDALAFRAAVMVAHCDNHGWGGPVVEELRAAVKKVPGPRDNLPMAPEHVTPDAGTFDPSRIVENLRRRIREVEEAAPVRCTCAYPLPVTAYGYAVHWEHCPAKAAHVCKRTPKHDGPPWERRAEVNPATMPDASAMPVVIREGCWGNETTCPDCDQRIGTRHKPGCGLAYLFPPKGAQTTKDRNGNAPPMCNKCGTAHSDQTCPTGARWPVTSKDTGEERSCHKCGQPEGTAHLARCPWNLANR